MKVRCPNCEEPIELDKNTHDEGDEVDCGECGASFIVTVQRGSLHLKPEKSKYDDVSDEFFDGYDE